jgi:hypothetical protein
LIDRVAADVVAFRALGVILLRRTNPAPPGQPVPIGLDEDPLLELPFVLHHSRHGRVSSLEMGTIIARPDKDLMRIPFRTD